MFSYKNKSSTYVKTKQWSRFKMASRFFHVLVNFGLLSNFTSLVYCCSILWKQWKALASRRMENNCLFIEVLDNAKNHLRRTTHLTVLFENAVVVVYLWMVSLNCFFLPTLLYRFLRMVHSSGSLLETMKEWTFCENNNINRNLCGAAIYFIIALGLCQLRPYPTALTKI